MQGSSELNGIARATFSQSAASIAHATAPARIEIPRFPGGKRIAVTTSWDDGRVEDRRLVAELNRLGIRGTFNLISGALGRADGSASATEKPGGPDAQYIDASEVAGLYAGHEVAIHTATHPFLCELDITQITTELLENRRALEDLVGYPVRGMAYPYGGSDARVHAAARAMGVTYGRTVEMRDPCFPPQDAMIWAPTAHQFATWPNTVDKRWQVFYSDRNSRGVYCIWGHSYEFAQRNDWDAVRRIFEPMSCKPDVWYCTNVELFDYEAARNRMVIAANRRTAHNPSGIPVTLKVNDTFVDVGPGSIVALEIVARAPAVAA